MIVLRGICNFCGKTSEEIDLIEGPNLSICSGCVRICASILESKDQEKKFKSQMVGPIPTPDIINEHLNKYVVGQEEAKKTLAVAVYNHYKRISQPEEDTEIEKSNILMVGPTGCGKTLMAKTLAKFLKVPFAIANATAMTEAGYVGEDVESIVARLLHNSEGDVESCQKGIIYIDEIDKIGKKESGRTIARDISGEGVQQGLLQIIEGSVIEVPPKGGRRSPDSKTTSVDTTNILFICGGAFDGLDELIKSRIKGEESIGFRAAITPHDKVELVGIQSMDFVKFGLIPEFLGRLPILAVLNELTIEDLGRILVEPTNSVISQYKKLFAMDEVELVFTKEALKTIAQKGLDRGTGARGLRAMIEMALLSTMYDVPKLKPIKCTITEEVISKGTEPELVYAE